MPPHSATGHQLSPFQNTSETTEANAPMQKMINLFIGTACPVLWLLFPEQQKSPKHRAIG